MQPRVNGCGMNRATLPDPELGRPLHTDDDNVAADPAHSHSGDGQRSGGNSVLRCLRHTFLRPLCCFPLAAGARPNAAYYGDGINCCWLPPVLGFAPIFWLTLFITIGVGAAAQLYWKPVLLTVFVALGYVISVALHEFGHAAVAYAGGDESVVHAGYLTLDYLRYASPIYTYGLPLLFVLFGGVALPGAAVRIHVGSLRSRAWESLTALAGPLMNLLVGFVASGVFHLLLVSGLPAYTLLHVGLVCLVYFSAMSVMLSLIPLPPFDGWAALSPWLPERFFLKSMMRSPIQGRIVQLLVVAALLPLFAHFFLYLFTDITLLHLVLQRAAVTALSDAVMFFAVRVFGSPPGLTGRALHFFYLPYHDWQLNAASPYTGDFFLHHGIPLGTGGM